MNSDTNLVCSDGSSMALTLPSVSAAQHTHLRFGSLLSNQLLPAASCRLCEALLEASAASGACCSTLRGC